MAKKMTSEYVILLLWWAVFIISGIARGAVRLIQGAGHLDAVPEPTWLIWLNLISLSAACYSTMQVLGLLATGRVLRSPEGERQGRHLARVRAADWVGRIGAGCFGAAMYLSVLDGEAGTGIRTLFFASTAAMVLGGGYLLIELVHRSRDQRAGICAPA